MLKQGSDKYSSDLDLPIYLKMSGQEAKGILKDKGLI